jgi:hypothetical protein
MVQPIEEDGTAGLPDLESFDLEELTPQPRQLTILVIDQERPSIEEKANLVWKEADGDGRQRLGQDVSPRRRYRPEGSV